MRNGGPSVTDCPEAIAAFDAAISLPIHRHMSIEDVDRVVDALTTSIEALTNQDAS